MYIIVIGRTSSILGAIGSRSKEVKRSREVKNLFREISALSERLFLVGFVFDCNILCFREMVTETVHEK